MVTKFFNIFSYIVVIIFFINDLTQDFIYYDYELELGWMFHVEVFCTALMFYLLAQQVYIIRKTSKNLNNVNNTIKNLQGEIAVYIESQFIHWKLTKAEKEVAWLILKGFSFKEIAKLRQVSEKTVQQQSSAIYKKSNTENRHTFISVFMDDFINLQS